MRWKNTLSPALVMVPAPVEPMEVFGLLNCGVLKMLKNTSLQYYFELKASPKKAWLYPGFNQDRTNQPYLVLRVL